MKQSQFLKRLKLQIPNIKETGYSDSDLIELINQGIDQTNLLAKVYQSYTDFNIVADQQIYNISEIAPTFLGPVKKRAYLLDDNSEWQPILPKTKDWIENKYRQWLNAESVSLPNWYWIEGDELGFYPPPNTSFSSGGRIFHLKKSTPMSSNDHYPWTGSTTQITAFIPLDDAILAYARWKLSPAFGTVTDVDLREKEFIKECAKGAKQIKRRPDITTDTEYGLKI